MKSSIFFLCCLLILASFLSLPVTGTTPLGNIPCDVNLFWSYETFSIATSNQWTHTAWTTVLPGGSRVEYYQQSGSHEITVGIYDKDGNEISVKTIQLPWEIALHYALCVPAARMIVCR